MQVRNCLNCNSDKTYVEKNGVNHWHHHKDGYLCHNCYYRLIQNPIKNPIRNPRRLNFKDKYLYLKEKPRKGICSICFRIVGDEIKQTQMHHFAEYHKDDPLRDTIELCVRCHRKVHVL